MFCTVIDDGSHWGANLPALDVISKALPDDKRQQLTVHLYGDNSRGEPYARFSLEENPFDKTGVVEAHAPLSGVAGPTLTRQYVWRFPIVLIRSSVSFLLIVRDGHGLPFFRSRCMSSQKKTSLHLEKSVIQVAPRLSLD